MILKAFWMFVSLRACKNLYFLQALRIFAGYSAAIHFSNCVPDWPSLLLHFEY
jgi:hypothetical protein